MTSPKQIPSVLRYFRASLSPLSRFIVWGPLSAIALGGVLLWQYQTHPEWLAQPQGQQAGTQADTDPVSSDPLSELSVDLDLPSQGLDNQAGKAPLFLPGGKDSQANLAPNLFAPLPQKSDGDAEGQDRPSKAGLPQLFAPLFPTKSQPASPPPNPTGSASLTRDLPKRQPVALSENPLQRAMEQLPASSPSRPTDLAPAAPPPTAPIAQPSYPNAYGRQPAPVQPSYPNAYGGQPAPVQPSYANPYGGQPAAPVQPYSLPGNNPYARQPASANPYQPDRNSPYGVTGPQVQPPVRGYADSF